jgi:hypothetical protein
MSTAVDANLPVMHREPTRASADIYPNEKVASSEEGGESDKLEESYGDHDVCVFGCCSLWPLVLIQIDQQDEAFPYHR